MTIKNKSVLSILLAGTFLSTTAAAADDVFTIKEGSESDYNFTMQEPDGNSNLVTKYYKTELNPSAFTNSTSIAWTEVGEDQKDDSDTDLSDGAVSGVISVKMLGKTQYFKYTYTKPTDYTVTSDSIDNTLASANVTNVVFNRTSSNDDIIYNREDNISIDIKADFIENSTTDEALGIIYNSGNMGKINGNFVHNYITRGGVIVNMYNTTIDGIYGDFIKNYLQASYIVNGFAIGNRGIINEIIGNFIGNYAESSGEIYGGAIYNSENIGGIEANFIGNSILSTSHNVYGGAVKNYMTVKYIKGNFLGNCAQSNYSSAQGGAIHNSGSIGNISGNFIGNYAMNESGTNIALGGAIFTTNDMTFSTQGETYFISGNYTKDNVHGKNYSALFVDNYGYSTVPTVTFDTSGGGAWIINDSIDGGKSSTTSINYSNQYNLAFKGDGEIGKDGKTTQYVAVNNDIINAGQVTVENTTLRFGAFDHGDDTAENSEGKGAFVAGESSSILPTLTLTNAAFDLYNGYTETINLNGLTSTDTVTGIVTNSFNVSLNNNTIGSGYLHIDVDVDELKADVLNINGDVEGTTNLLIYANSEKDIRGKSILFAQSTNDTTGNADSFKVWRVYKSPYLYDIKYTQTAADANKWELSMNDTVNPDASQKPSIPENPDVPDINIPTSKKVAPEVIAYGALPTAAIEQTRNMIGNINGEVTKNTSARRAWINPTYYKSSSDALFDVDADIWGVEAGGDLQHNLNNRLGLFASYRNGEYDMNGQGHHYYSPTASEIEIDSYLAGLYYRYDKNNWYAFATVYGGMQKADLKTNDGVKSDTDGIEFGGSLEVGYDYALNKTVYVTPSLGVFYSQVNYDDAKDNAGKKVEYNDLSQVELEAGIKLTKSFWYDDGFANIYVKPSIVQTIINGDEITITGLGKVDSMDDDTLGRIELGGRYGLSQALSAYGWANYTFGSDYDATTFGAGLNYVF